MPLHPIRALDAVIDEYRDHLRSEFRARDRALRQALEDELDRPLFLAQEPFYQAHRPFRNGESWSDLPLDPALARKMAERSHNAQAYLHQSISVSHLLGATASPLVVTTGTGSGKTECFLLPVIQNAINDAREFPRQSGLTAILIYPMNALANDQEKRIKEYLEAAGVAELVDVRKFDRGTRQADRERMRTNPPRILLTNYMMLEYLLVRPADRDAIFANHRCRFLVLDEVHTYRGVLGSNIALLIRRLRAHLGRARQNWQPEAEGDRARRRYPRLVAVGTSATIKSVTDPLLSAEGRLNARDRAVQDFFSRLTGEDGASIRVVGEVLEDITVPSAARFSASVPVVGEVNVGDSESIKAALCASAGVPLTVSLAQAALSCRLLWLLNQWLVGAPMSVHLAVDRLRAEVPERRDADNEALRREVEAVLVAGAALPDDIQGVLRLRAHRLIRGGWQFVRCVDPACGRVYPMGAPQCSCGQRTAPLFLCRSCGADYLRLSGDPSTGQMQPYDKAAPGGEWMLYDPSRHETTEAGGDDDEEEMESVAQPQRRGSRPRIEQVRGQPVYSGSLDPRSMVFSPLAGDDPNSVRLVGGRSRCLCCGGTAGTRAVITAVSLGTSAAVKVLCEGLVEALAEANSDKPDHDGKERLLVFSDSRQDAAHQARFIIFASRYDRMRRRLVQILQADGPLSIQRAVERLGEIGVREQDNPNGPDDPERRLSEDERLRVRAWEEAPLLDEIAVTPFFRGTLINLGLVSVRYDGLVDEVTARGAALCLRLGISAEHLAHLCRCFLDEVRVRSMISREMLRYHPKHPSFPEFIQRADWERKVAQPKGLPLSTSGHPVPHGDNQAAPIGITQRNPWRAPGAGGRSPSFQRLVDSLLARMGGSPTSPEDGSAILRFLELGGFLVAADVYGIRESYQVCQLNHEIVRLWMPAPQERLRCNVCSWPLSGAQLGQPCPRCHGAAAAWPQEEVDAHRTVRRLRAPRYLPLVAQEHTAQVTNDRRVQLETDFKASAANAGLNLLACSPTMEMGIDVGGLDAVVLRNVPPRPDNYAQRGGRAGRRTRIGLVVGYARNTPHDQYFFDHPEEMISGEIPAPTMSLGNRDVILRHLSAIAFGAADPGLAGRMLEYVTTEGTIRTEVVSSLIEGVRAQIGHALEMARIAWGPEILDACQLNQEALRRHLDELPARITNVMEATAHQVNELRRPLESYAANLVGRQIGTRAADLVARLLGVPTSQRDSRPEADDSSAGYPLRRFAEFGILPGYEFPSEPAAVRLLGDPNEGEPVTVARRFGIYQFMPSAPVYARAKRWKVVGLDMSSPWNPRVEAPWSYRICRACGLHYSNDHASCPRCHLAEAGRAFPAFEYGGFLAQKNEAPVLDEEDRIAARNLVQFYPQRNGDVFERWSASPGWQLVLSRNEEIRWLNEGLEPTESERERGGLLHNEAKGFCLCGTCGKELKVPENEEGGGGRRRARNGGSARDPFGHSAQCAHSGQGPVPAAIATGLRAEVLRLDVYLPERLDELAAEEWAHSLGAALRIGIRQHFLLDGAEIEFEPEGPWQEASDAGSFQRMSLTFVDPSVGGSGYISRIAREFHLVARRALQHLQHENCETACYRCLKSYQNQRHHDVLRWPAIVPDLESLAEAAPQPLPLELGDRHNPRPWLEAFAAGVGSPLELRFLQLFEQCGFTPQRQVPVGPGDGQAPISIADFAVPERRLAIYVDGAAFHVGLRLRRDRIIRERLRQGHPAWRVVSLRASDLARGRGLVAELQG